MYTSAMPMKRKYIGKVMNARPDRKCPLGKKCMTRTQAYAQLVDLTAGGWRPYKCRHCGWWHMTSQSPRR